MTLNTHLKLDSTLNGKAVELGEGYAKIELQTTDAMRADEDFSTQIIIIHAISKLSNHEQNKLGRNRE